MPVQAFVDVVACRVVSLEGGCPIGFLWRIQEGQAAARRRAEKLQKRVRETRWMRAARGLYGEARVAGMYRNEWVHFGEFTRVPVCLLEGALYTPTSLSPRVAAVYSNMQRLHLREFAIEALRTAYCTETENLKEAPLYFCFWYVYCQIAKFFLRFFV